VKKKIDRIGDTKWSTMQRDEGERALFLAAEEGVSRDVETLKWDRQEESEEEGRQVLVCCMPRLSLAWLTGISQFESHLTLRSSSMTGGCADASKK
jgi:hypothetical protein